MKATDIMHPEDAKAIQMIKKTKRLNPLVRKIMDYGYEKKLRGIILGNHLKVNAHNLPKVYQAFKDVVRKVGIKEPELYIFQDTDLFAYTYGETNTFICVSSTLVKEFTVEELQCVIAHECGHLLCKHSFYKSILRILMDMQDALGIITWIAFEPLYFALQYWNRKGELSADRCAAAVTGESVFQSMMLKLSSGVDAKIVNRSPLLDQAEEYHKLKNASWWNRIQQTSREAACSHPYDCERAYEIDRWKNSWQYRRLRSIDCRTD